MPDPEARAFLDWDGVRELARRGFDIGSHTVEHPILSRVDTDRLGVELRESKAVIEREIRKRCTSIAYPNGSPRDVSEDVFRETWAAGYECAFTTTPTWYRRDMGRRIPRIPFPGHTDLATFKLYASGLHTELTDARARATQAIYAVRARLRRSHGRTIEAQTDRSVSADTRQSRASKSKKASGGL